MLYIRLLSPIFQQTKFVLIVTQNFTNFCFISIFCYTTFSNCAIETATELVIQRNADRTKITIENMQSIPEKHPVLISILSLEDFFDKKTPNNVNLKEILQIFHQLFNYTFY